MEGETIPRLPMGPAAPELSADIKLASQRGMHSPSYSDLDSKGADKKKYVLSVHSAGGPSLSPFSESVAYEDGEVVEHQDGTWTLEYSCQTAMPGKKLTDKSNTYMMNNLTDGVPVAVMLKNKSGYAVYGLAYVEMYNPLTGMFTLHGPVSAEAKGVHFYSEVAYEQLSPNEQALLKAADDFDGEAYVAVQAMRRKRQGKFRNDLLAAYEGSCAVTDVSVESVLQAAHIDPFARSRSHAVSNGLLLRSDIHLLYDAHLMTVLPSSGRIVVSEAIEEPLYRELHGRRMRFPEDSRLRPKDDLLAIHARSYNNQQRMFGLSCA